MAIVYIVTNTKNGGQYIGCTKRTMQMRRAQHERDARKQRGRGAFHRALRKHPANVFVWAVHKEFATRDEAAAEERRLIEELRPRYNSTKGGEAYTPRVLSKEARTRISMANRGNTYRLGQTHTEEVRNKLRALGYRDREKWLHRARMGPRSQARRVVCLNDGASYESASAAARAYGTSKSLIIELCNRDPRRQTAAGRVFRYADDWHESADDVNRLCNSAKATSSSGFRGVSPHVSSAGGRVRWRAQLSVRRDGVKQRHHIGIFDTPEEAHAAYLQRRTEVS